MSYQQAMEAAGAYVADFEEFGSYQGDWWAKVEFNGRTGFVRGYFGSCTGCDAFQGEFGYHEERCDEHRWKRPEEFADCPSCKSKAASYQERLAAFGAEYLEDIQSAETAVMNASRNLDWDSDARAMVDWIKARA